MKIKELYQENQPQISFEVFPPKKESDAETIMASLDQMTALKMCIRDRKKRWLLLTVWAILCCSVLPMYWVDKI